MCVCGAAREGGGGSQEKRLDGKGLSIPLCVV